METVRDRHTTPCFHLKIFRHEPSTAGLRFVDGQADGQLATSTSSPGRNPSLGSDGSLKMLKISKDLEPALLLLHFIHHLCSTRSRLELGVSSPEAFGQLLLVRQADGSSLHFILRLQVKWPLPFAPLVHGHWQDDCVLTISECLGVYRTWVLICMRRLFLMQLLMCTLIGGL